MVDLNGDGYRDVLSGSWPGEIFFFKGGPDNSFAAPEMLRYKDGRIINIGGGIKEEDDGNILITGNAKFEQTPEGTFAVYHGKRIKSTPEKRVAITGMASAVHAADWDGDGDLDLLVGNIEGALYLIPNEGTATSYAFGEEQSLTADGRTIGTSRNAAPFVVDWDGDGDPDLLLGAGNGSVSLYRNVGTAKTPRLAAAEELVPATTLGRGRDTPKEARRGNRSRVCAADWNGDGKLDLLVGDSTRQKPDRPEPTPEEKAEHQKMRRELDSLNERYGDLRNKIMGPERAKTQEEIDEATDELSELRLKMIDLRAKLPPEYESHGWVWLFLRMK